MGDIDNSEDVISMDDVTERFAELRDERAGLVEAVEEAQGALNDLPDDASEDDRTEAEDELAYARKSLQEFDSNDGDELETLTKLLDETRGYGGDHQFEGDWYPGSLIRESYFVEYVQEMLADIGDLPRDLPGYIAIDWDKTADNIRVDYSTADFDGVEYLYR
jgi:hypothetical protein